MMRNRGGVDNSNYKHGLRKTRLYRIWANMKTRCSNVNSPAYKWYGSRGISICNEWVGDFQSFYDWAMENGYSDDLTIDRIDNDGNYEPNNCRWVTVRKQCTNKNDNHLVALNGITKCLITWCEIYNINYKTVRDRLKRGWSYERALTEVVNIKFRRKG